VQDVRLPVEAAQALAWHLKVGTDAGMEAAAGALATPTFAVTNRNHVLSTDAVETLVEMVRTGGNARAEDTNQVEPHTRTHLVLGQLANVDKPSLT
jgi:hypothetical protein